MFVHVLEVAHKGLDARSCEDPMGWFVMFIAMLPSVMSDDCRLLFHLILHQVSRSPGPGPGGGLGEARTVRRQFRGREAARLLAPPGRAAHQPVRRLQPLQSGQAWAQAEFLLSIACPPTLSSHSPRAAAVDNPRREVDFPSLKLKRLHLGAACACARANVDCSAVPALSPGSPT